MKLIYFCLTVNITIHNTPLNGVRVFSYVQQRTDGRMEQIVTSATERKQTVILSRE